MTGLSQLFLDVKNRLLSIPDGVYKYAAIFTGAGLNDATFSGTYSGRTINAAFVITISSVGATDTFSWTCGTFSGTNIAITGNAQYLIYGMSITFAAITGHTLNNSWSLSVTGTPLIKFCQVWNSQTTLEIEGHTYDFEKPAVFVEFISPNTIEQLGNGDQIYNDLIVRLHIVHEFYNAIDGNGIEEQDLTIFDLSGACYQYLNKFEPTQAVAMVRVNESQQYNHKNVYEYLQDYKTNLVDAIIDEPIGFLLKQPPTNYQGNVDTEITYSQGPFTLPL